MKKLTFILLLSILTGCQKPQALTAYDLDDQPIHFFSEPVWYVVNYWAEWCTPCRHEIPELNKIAEQYAHQVKILGINPDGGHIDDLKYAVKSLNIQFPILKQDPGIALGLQPIQALPTTYVISPKGKVYGPFLGAQSQQSLSKIIPFKERSQS